MGDNFEFFELLAFLAAVGFFEKCTLRHFQLRTFGTAGRDDFRFARLRFGIAHELHRFAVHNRAQALRYGETGAAQQNQECHQDGDRSV